MFSEYPKAKYHVGGANCVVYSQEEDAAQNPREWFDHPDKAKAGPPPEPPEPPKPRGRPPLKMKTDDGRTLVDEGK